MATLKLDYTPLLVQPYTDDLFKMWGWWKKWRSSQADVARLLQRQDVVACIATGGFASGPPVLVCHQHKIPIVLINLDSVPGKANRFCAKYASTVFSAYEGALARAHFTGLPLRKSSIGPRDEAMARKQLKIDPQRHTLLVIGGSQGSSSINTAMADVVARPSIHSALAEGWQILHVTGGKETDHLQQLYASLKIPAKTVDFFLKMGLPWSAASLAISRAGAGSVAEVWANATPTIFMPYPYHKDDHQRYNAMPLVEKGAAVIVRDHAGDTEATAEELATQLTELIQDPGRLASMSQALRRDPPRDGAAEVADWLTEMLHT